MPTPACAAFWTSWQGPQRVFLFVPSEKRPEAAQWLPGAATFLIAESGGKAVYSNRPPGLRADSGAARK